MKKIISSIYLFFVLGLLLIVTGCEGNPSSIQETLKTPENVRVVVSENDCMVFFTTVDNADSYNLYLYVENSSSFFKKYHVNENEILYGYKLTLESGNYELAVSAFDSDLVYGESNKSLKVPFTVESKTPNPPIGEDEDRITYNLNGGTLPDDALFSYKTNKKYILPIPTKTNCTFLGWYLESNFINKIAVISDYTGDLVLYAKWKNNQEGSLEAYYINASGLVGSELKLALRKIISSNVKSVSYRDLRTKLAYTDQDPNNSNNLLLVFSRASVDATWDYGNTWNREHVWPKSKGWFVENGAGCDIHHIRPEDPTVNEIHGNLPYGYVTNGRNVTYNGAIVAKVSSSCFEPLDSAKGDIARIVFYLLVRYSESDTYQITNVATSMEMLLTWNDLDPVDDFELLRNERSFNVQNNRNPFIDHPEFARLIWG